MNTIALELYKQFNELEANFSALLDCCTTDVQRERLRAAYVQGWRNYNLAINHVFDFNDEQIQQLHTDLVAQGQLLTTALTDLENFANTLDTVAKVVAFGATIVLA